MDRVDLSLHRLKSVAYSMQSSVLLIVARRLWRWVGWIGKRWLVWLVLAGVITAGLLLVGAVILPQHLLDTRGLTAEARLKAENDLRGALVTVLGGIIVAIGAVVGILNLRETSRQNRATAEQNRAVLELQRRGQLAERFTKAIEQLGQGAPEKLDVRIGAAYALEQIALDSSELHWPVMEVLTAYLREHAKPQAFPPPPTDEGREPLAEPSMAADLQAMVTVVGRRRQDQDPPGRRLNLTGVELEGADLSAAQLEGALLVGAQLEGANLSWAHLEGAYLRGAHLEGAYLFAARLKGAHLREAQLEAADLTRAQLQGASLFAAQLKGANLREAQLVGVNLVGAHLQGAHLSGAQLVGANLVGAQLVGADLSGAQMEGAKLLKSNLREAVLTGVLGLTWDQLRAAGSIEGVKLPDYLVAHEGVKLPDYLVAQSETEAAGDPSPEPDVPDS